MKHLTLPLVIAACALTSCHSARHNTDTHITATIAAPPQAILAGPVRAMPRAVIYRTNGNWNNNVTVNVDPATGQLISYPATTDVDAESAPLVLRDGWLLDRRGGVNPSTTRFLRYTYARYHGLAQTPSLQQILDSIIPEARVTQTMTLDMTTFKAQTDTAQVNRIISELGQ